MKLILILLVLCAQVINAQLIDNRECVAFTDEPFFYSHFLQKNGIKEIIGTISTKENLKVIQSKNQTNSYQFNRKGKLIQQVKTFYRGAVKDTTVIHFEYNNDDQLIRERISDRYGYFSYDFEYNEQGLLQTKAYNRDQNKLSTKNNFELSKQHQIVKETYSYINQDSVQYKYTFNGYGKKYQTEIDHYNEHNLKYKQEKILLINKKKSLIYFNYNDKGLVSEKTMFPQHNSPDNYAVKYQYDSLGNLEFIDEYHNDVHKTHKEIIYNKETLLMKALLIQDIETNYIKIIKYSYNYWQGGN